MDCLGGWLSQLGRKMSSLVRCWDGAIPQGASCGDTVLSGMEEEKLELSIEGKELWLGV